MLVINVTKPADVHQASAAQQSLETTPTRAVAAHARAYVDSLFDLSPFSDAQDSPGDSIAERSDRDNNVSLLPRDSKLSDMLTCVLDTLGLPVYKW